MMKIKAICRVNPEDTPDKNGKQHYFNEVFLHKYKTIKSWIDDNQEILWNCGFNTLSHYSIRGFDYMNYIVHIDLFDKNKAKQDSYDFFSDEWIEYLNTCIMSRYNIAAQNVGYTFGQSYDWNNCYNSYMSRGSNSVGKRFLIDSVIDFFYKGDKEKFCKRFKVDEKNIYGKLDYNLPSKARRYVFRAIAIRFASSVEKVLKKYDPKKMNFGIKLDINTKMEIFTAMMAGVEDVQRTVLSIDVKKPTLFSKLKLWYIHKVTKESILLSEVHFNSHNKMYSFIESMLKKDYIEGYCLYQFLDKKFGVKDLNDVVNLKFLKKIAKINNKF